MATRLTIDPNRFTRGAWIELYNCSDILPQSMETIDNARKVRRQKYQIRQAILLAVDKLNHIDALCPVEQDRKGNAAWKNDLRFVVKELSKLTGDAVDYREIH